MGTEENKAVVRRFWNEVLAEGNLDVIDEVVAPDYRNFNLEIAGPDVASLKESVTTALAAVKEHRFDEQWLVVEDDLVFARFNYVATQPDGVTTTERAIACYRVIDGRIATSDFIVIEP